MNNDNYNNPSPQQLAEINGKITRFGAVLLAVAVVMACFAYAKAENPAVRVILFVLSGILAAIGLFVIVVVALGARMEKNKTNYFLYDQKTKQNIAPSELTVGEIRERITRYMAVFKRRGKLYIGELFELSVIPEYYKPLFCYELLCQIAEEGNEKAEIFLSYGAECSRIFDRYLSSTEDYELVRQIHSYMYEFASEKKEAKARFARYLEAQKQYIEDRMLQYTLQNIDKF